MRHERDSISPVAKFGGGQFPRAVQSVNPFAQPHHHFFRTRLLHVRAQRLRRAGERRKGLLLRARCVVAAIGGNPENGGAGAGGEAQEQAREQQQQ